MNEYLQKLLNREALTTDEMKIVIAEMFGEEISDSEIAGILIALKAKGETADEITGIVKMLRQHALPFNKKLSGVMDNCGTGGDGSHSFNVSTTSAFVLAAAGFKGGENGKHSPISKTGSADVLEKLGVNLTIPPAFAEELLDEIGIAFLYAPHVQPNLRRIMKVRKELRVPTVFNLIGPLTNPITLDYQLVGLYHKDYLELFADVLNRLGRKRAVVVNGAGSMDEASLQGENHIVVVENGTFQSFSLTASDVGLQNVSNQMIVGGDADVNASILQRVLQGEKGAYRDTVLLNAGLGIYAGGKADSVKEGIAIAEASIDSGKAYGILQQLIEKSEKVGVK